MDDDKYMTKEMCALQTKIISVQFEMLREKDKEIEKSVSAIGGRILIIDEKIDKLVGLQEKLNSYLLYLAIGVILTLIGVLTGRALDFGWLL